MNANAGRKGKRARWVTPEIARLRQTWATASRQEIETALPRHSWASIRSTAHDLGLRRSYGDRRWLAIAASHVPTFDFSRAAAALQPAE